MTNLLLQIKYIWKAHITNWLWYDRKKRRNIRRLAFGDVKLAYLGKYIPYIQSISSTTEIVEVPENEEKVFSLWLQDIDTAPDIVQKCVNSLRNHFKERFILLNEKNIGDYIILPEYIIKKWENKQMIPAHFSDIVRMELLSKYGGYWFDATDFIFRDIPEDIVNSDFFMYAATPYRELEYTCMQNYFIRAKKGDPLLDMWKQVVYYYWQKEDHAVGYFLVQLLFRLLITYNAEAKSYYEKIIKIPLEYPELLWQEWGNEPYTPEKFRELKEKAFFNKCSYKSRIGIVKKIIPDSMADFILNGRIKDSITTK